jgi:6-phosphogluconate dehydrogenase (decarboxylating)
MVLICKKQYTFEYQKINKLYHNGSYICSFSLNIKLIFNIIRELKEIDTLIYLNLNLLSIILILIFDLSIK